MSVPPGPSPAPSTRRAPVRPSWELAVWALILAYIAYFGTLTIRRHDAFLTTAFDLGNVDQAVWNTRHGRPLALTNIEGLTNRLGTHVEPILLPISLLYFLWSDPRALLLLQTAVIALGAWPLYLLARRRLSPSALPFLFSLAYLLFPALQSANLFDFHAVALAPTFFLFALYFLETERWGAYALFSVLTLSCKEDMPLLVAMLGLYALLIRRRWVVGLVTLVASGAWFVAAVGWIMPHFDTAAVSPFSSRYAYLGDGPLDMLATLLTHPGLVLDHLRSAGALPYLRDLLAPLAFLSLLAPQVLVLAAPSLAVNLLSTEGYMHQLEGFHYGATLAPVVVVSAAYGAAWLLRRALRLRALPFLLAAAVLAATLMYHRGHGYTPLAAGYRQRWPAVTDHHRLGAEIAAAIPADASLAALPRLNPHASRRQQLTMIDRVENGLPAPLHDADYVWLDVTDSWPLHPNDLKAGVEALLAGPYGVERAADGWLLLRRGAEDRDLPAAFYDFARSPDPRPQYTMQLQFRLRGEPALECLGFDLAWQPDGVRSTFYWRALQPLPPGLRLYPFYFDDDTGQIREDTGQRPLVATLWYPPDHWVPGEVVATGTLPWPIGPDFSLGLGVVQGEDWAGVDRRLPLRVESSHVVIRLFDGDTWARLLAVRDGEPLEERRVFTPPSRQHPLDADLGGLVRLLGDDLDCDRRRGACELTLYWQAQQRLEVSYTVFAQLLDPAGAVATQVDAIPRQGSYPTVWWLPGEIVADPLTLTLPAEGPRGATYRLIVGLYNSVTGARLPVAGTGQDFVELERLQP